MLFDATIEIKGIDRKGMLLDVSKVISDQLGINIHKLTISSDNGIFDGTIELRIHDRDEVKIIMDQAQEILRICRKCRESYNSNINLL